MLLLNILFHRGNWPSLPFVLPDHRSVKINWMFSYDFRKNSEQLGMNMDWKNCSHVVRLCPVNTYCTVDWKNWGVDARHIPGSLGWAPVCPTAGSSRGRTCWRGGSPSSAIPSQISWYQISWYQISWSPFPQLISLSRWHYSLLIIGSRPALPHWYTKSKGITVYPSTTAPQNTQN
jgi:hypothetical protein